MSYVVAKKKYDGGFNFVRSLSRNDDIKENELTIPDHKPIWVKEYKSEETAIKDLEKMKERGYDDYSVYNFDDLEFKYNSRGALI